MSSDKITKAMILAAGRGTRMRHLTDAVPKPLVKVADRPLIDYMLDKAQAAGVTECVVNLCYLGDMIRSRLEKRTGMKIVFSVEAEALETGGGVKKALPLLGDKPFFVLNSDPLWTEPAEPALKKLEQAWNPETTDVLLMLQPMNRVFEHDGTGDYFIEDGKPRRRVAGETSAPYVFAGAQILHPRIFKESPEGKFRLTELYDKAERAGRLQCIVHDGDWFHVGTPEATALAEKVFGGHRSE